LFFNSKILNPNATRNINQQTLAGVIKNSSGGISFLPTISLVERTRAISLPSIFMVALGLSIFELKNNRRFGWFDILYFSVIGMIGWMVFFLDFFTDHVATKQNLNLLWAIPVHLPVFLFWGKLPLRFRFIYSWIFLVLNGLLLMLWPFMPQQYHVAFIPLIIIMVMRLLLMISWQQDKYEIIKSNNKN
jgi:hypothetical protein